LGNTQNELVRIAKRENNAKRSYLVVNPLQAKHVPVSPATAIGLFEKLAEKVKEKYSGQKLLVIGFAETATAIGAQVAISLDAFYMQTTREMIPGVEYLFFSEEHSHATEQKLVRCDVERALAQTPRILFVEDEVTTGNTIRNIITLLRREFSEELVFSVASILNAVEGEHLAWYREQEIDFFYLQKTDHSAYEKKAAAVKGDGAYFAPETINGEIKVQYRIGGALNARRLTDGGAYRLACERLYEQVSQNLGKIQNQRILVIGTEETMYPAIYVGKRLEELGNIVRTHSTTRSPICVDNASEYPLHERYELRSLYDDERRTFLYNIESYQMVLIVTDASPVCETGLATLISALRKKNEDIRLVRWCCE